MYFLGHESLEACYNWLYDKLLVKALLSRGCARYNGASRASPDSFPAPLYDVFQRPDRNRSK